MSIDQAESQAAYRSITSRTKRAYGVAVTVNLVMGVLISASWVSAVIALPSVLLAAAALLQHTDPERAAAELAAIQRLTAETIEQGRSLAHSTHQLVLAAELANAVDLLEAARIAVQVEDSRGGGLAHEAAFALVLREGTTNVLRHSQADQVWITITDDSLSIRNNGAAPGTEPALRGLATLQQRIGQEGGRLSVSQERSTFTVAVSFAKDPV